MAAGRTPEFIGRWLDASDGANPGVLDGPQQFLGSEPNTLLAESGFDRGALWRDRSAVRWLLAASWPYEQSAGNMALPGVYWGINDADPGYPAAPGLPGRPVVPAGHAAGHGAPGGCRPARVRHRDPASAARLRCGRHVRQLQRAVR